MKTRESEEGQALHGQLPAYVDNPCDEDYAHAARSALKRGDLGLAIEQISAAIALAPLHESHLQLLNNILARSRRPLQLVALPKDGAFYGLCAIRSRVLAQLNSIDAGLSLLFAVAVFRPGIPFLVWTRDWIATRDQCRRVRPNTVALGLVRLADAVRGRKLETGLRQNVQAALELAAAVQKRYQQNGDLAASRSRMLRVLGHLAEAQKCLDAIEECTWSIAVERAASYEEQGDRRQRITWLERACELSPREPSTSRDLAEAWLDEGELTKSLEAYERVGTLDTNSEPARLGIAFVKGLLGNREMLTELVVDQENEVSRLVMLADVTSYDTRLCDPVDPVVAVIRSIAVQAADPSRRGLRVRVRADRPLAPSALVAFRQLLERHEREGTLEVVCSRRPEFGLLWEPQAAAPTSRHTGLVMELVQIPFHWKRWCDRATELSVDCADDLESILRTMAHPPASPSGLDVVHWVHSVQVATALLIAHTPSPAAARVSLLTKLLRAVDDWSSAAAALGLRALAAVHPECRHQITDALHTMMPEDGAPLGPGAMAIGVAGAELSTADKKAAFLRLRARVRRELQSQR